MKGWRGKGFAMLVNSTRREKQESPGLLPASLAPDIHVTRVLDISIIRWAREKGMM